MSLSGLLTVIAADPQLRRALELAEGEAGHTAVSASGGADFIGPPALRPVLAAALAGLAAPGPAGPPAAARFVLAVTATAREAEDLTAALNSLLPASQRGLLPALGDAAARAPVAADPTPPGSGSRCCAGSPGRTAATRGPAR